MGAGGAELVVEQTHLHPFGRFGFEGIEEAAAGCVVANDEALQVNVVFCGADGIEHLRVSLIAVHK